MFKIEMLKMLDRDSVNALMRPEQILFAVREAFCLHSAGNGQVFPVVREALSTGGIFGIKFGGIANQGVLGFNAAGFFEPQFSERSSVRHSASANDAVSQSDVVITATPGGQVLFDLEKPFNLVRISTAWVQTLRANGKRRKGLRPRLKYLSTIKPKLVSLAKSNGCRLRQ